MTILMAGRHGSFATPDAWTLVRRLYVFYAMPVCGLHTETRRGRITDNVHGGCPSHVKHSIIARPKPDTLPDVHRIGDRSVPEVITSSRNGLETRVLFQNEPADHPVPAHTPLAQLFFEQSYTDAWRLHVRAARFGALATRALMVSAFPAHASPPPARAALKRRPEWPPS